MKKLNKNKRGAWGFVMTAITLLGFGVCAVDAQDILINTRPLTPQEIGDYALPGGTQTSGGTPVVGLGQPVYLELLVEAGTVVTQATWSLDSVLNADDEPISSAATITNSPLPESMPTYNSVDRVHYDVIDRALIVPDVRGTYTVSVEVLTSNAVLNASLGVVGSTFLGQNNAGCLLCHDSKQADFNMTGHANTFKKYINDPNSHFQEFCIKCHSVGYDTTPGAVNAGFDDVASDLGWEFPESLGTNNWDDMPVELQNKASVQCENCHGPAQEHMRTGGDIGKIGVSLSAGNCGQCHDAVAHHQKNFQWGQSLHGNTEVDRGEGSCAQCHTAAGYINTNDPGVNEYGNEVPTTATFTEGITCAACHDPHGPGMGSHQLRVIESVELGNGDVITAGGDGKVCMACHKSRRDGEDYVLGNANKYFGPHHGPQSDMLAGANAVEYGQDLPSSQHLNVVADSCSQCHMQEEPGDIPDYAKNMVGEHTFTLSFDDGTNAVIHLTETCTSCHGDIEDFDFGGEDYNSDGLVEGVQTEIHHLLNELGMLLPPIGDPSVNMYGQSSEFNTQPLRSGAYNYMFVEEDGSLGVHNPKYAAALLRSSIADIKGGIDVDCDGLVDAWELENFGDLTSQTGMDDYDGDGLSNEAEAKLGTSALLTDTDGDGFSDLVELQGNSDPLDDASVPTADMIILDAVELGYMPKATGTTVNIQMATDLNGGVWTNIGTARESTGDWIYELESTRGSTNRFYRAVEE